MAGPLSPEPHTRLGGPTLAVRCDSTRAMGLGHLSRSLAVASEWLSRGLPALWVGEVDAPLDSVTWPEGLGRHPLTRGEALDAERLAAALGGWPRPWVVVADGYHLGEPYLRGLSEAFDFVVALEDFKRLDAYPVDLLVNPGGTASELLGAVSGACLQGPDYRIIDRRFHRARETGAPIASTARNLLVTMGGGDPDDVTGVIVDDLIANEDLVDLSIRVVLGPTYPFADRLRKRLSTRPSARRPNVELVIGADMPELMGWSHMAVSAAGGTAAELAFMGVPAFLVPWAENQKPNAVLFSEFGCAVNAGWDVQRQRPERPLAVSELAANPVQRSRMAEAGRRVIDGRGAARIVDQVLRRTQRMVG